MINRKSPIRHQSRFPVSWSLVYGSDEFFAEGTALDLTARGWRIAGPMPVVPGLPLTLQIWVPDKPEPLRIRRATVLWVKDYEFAIEVHEMAPRDRAWVTDFLNEKLGRSWISRSVTQKSSFETSDAAFCRKAGVPRLVPVHTKEVLRRLLTSYTRAADTSAQAPWNSDSASQDDEVYAASDRVLEEVWYPVICLVRRMTTLRTSRERTGRDAIADN